MTTYKFNDHQSAAARIILHDDSSVSLLSYKTVVAYVSSDGWLTINGLYSMTTRKHIGWFMKEYDLDYATARALFENHQTMNVYTFEVRDI